MEGKRQKWSMFMIFFSDVPNNIIFHYRKLQLQKRKETKTLFAFVWVKANLRL